MKSKLSILFLICFSFAFSQSKRLFIYKGDEFFNKMDYINAVDQYNMALSDSVEKNSRVVPYGTDITNQKLPKTKIKVDSTITVTLEEYLHHQVALCYFRIFDYENSEVHFKRTTDINVYPHDRYFYALSLMNNKEYDKAIEQFEQYIRSPQADDEYSHASQVAMTGCFFAKEDLNKVKKVRIDFADSAVFNNGTSAFAPTFFGSDKRMIFSSAREGGVILDERQDSRYLLDLYYTEMNEDGTWGLPQNFGRPLNSAQHDAAAAVANNNIVYFTRWNDVNRKDQNIFMARMVDFKFYESQKLDTLVNVPGYKSMQPFISMDGKYLYYSSNRKGGFGGMDLWRVELTEDGLPMGNLENLGALVNSDQDEFAPFFHEASSTFFFSSNGHGSIGGLDIFKSFYDRDLSTFNTPVNLGTPINSSYDDSYLIWDTKLENGYFSSDREPCSGGHCYDIYKISNEPIVIRVKGYTYDKETEEILPNCKVTFKDVDGEFRPITMYSDANGYYDTVVRNGLEIFIKAQQTGYFADATSIDTKIITESTEMQKDFYLAKIPSGEIEIDGIEYDFNSANLRPISMEILDKLVEFLELNNNISVEINSHTDARGSDIYNLDLSQRRAKSCVDYLISKGIDPNRLVPKGYGETDPAVLVGTDKKPILDGNGKEIVLTEAYINSKKTKEEKEKLHQKNRRTAFKVTNSKL
jgi:OmpA-OmpF porin, OOP family